MILCPHPTAREAENCSLVVSSRRCAKYMDYFLMCLLLWWTTSYLSQRSFYLWYIYYLIIIIVKVESEKVGLKLNIQKTKIMASGPITSWQIEGETMETVRDFIFLGSKITADGDCSHEIKRCLVLGRKSLTNLDSIFKSRNITLPTKFCLLKVMVFPVIMYGCELDYKESWAPKDWCFWTVVLEKTLESPFDCKDIQPVNPKGRTWCWSWNFNTLATWCEELTHW